MKKCGSTDDPMTLIQFSNWDSRMVKNCARRVAVLDLQTLLGIENFM